LVLLVGFAWAGGGSESEPAEDVGFAGREVHLKIGFLAGHVDPTEHMGDFLAKFPKITFEIMPIPAADWPEYITTLQTMSVSGTAPDVYHIPIEGIRRLVSVDLAMPMDEYLTEYPEYAEEYDDIHPALQEIFIIDGVTYALAADWNNCILHMNLDMLEEAGLSLPDEDWGTAEFLEYMDALTVTRADGAKVFGTMLPSFYYNLEAWLYAFGAATLNEEMNECTLTDPEAVAAYHFMYDLVYKYGYAPVPQTEDDAINSFVAGNIASACMGRWPVGRFVEAGMNWDIQYLPLFAAERNAIFGVGSYCVWEGTKYPEEAFVLASWMSGPYAQEHMLGGNSIPSRISIMDKMLPNSPPANGMIFKESAYIGSGTRCPPEYPDVANIAKRYYFQIMSNEIGIEEGLAKAKAEIDALF
jgi:ABC-type glycerol-3-phosphate transport system substrate-binding protein